MTIRHVTFLNVTFMLIAITFSAVEAKKNIEDKLNFLKKTSVIPKHYDVKINVNFNNNILLGECNITINIIRLIMHITIPKIFGILKIYLTDNKIINFFI